MARPPGAGGSGRGFAALLAQTQELVNKGKTAEAIARVRAALARDARSADTAAYLSTLLVRAGELVQAQHYAKQALTLDPGNQGARLALAMTLLAMGKAPEAVDLLRALTRDAPDVAAPAEKLAEALDQMGQFDEAIDVCEGALTRGLISSPLQLQLAGLLHRQGEHDRARAMLRQLQAQEPTNVDAAIQLAALSNYDAGTTAQQSAAAHARAGMLLADHVGCGPAGIFGVGAPGRARPKHAAILSPDLARHSVAYFALPLARAIKAAGWRLTLYSSGLREDEVTGAFRALADGFVHVAGHSSFELATRIHDDAVTVLFELSGYTKGHRQRALALRPAPVQVTAIGYPATTGNRAIDWRIVDARTDPPGSEVLCTERLARLDPVFLCYDPPGDAPPARTPIGSDEPLTLGSFNAFQKLSARTLALWARVMQRLPAARLLLKGTMLAGQRASDRLQAAMRDAGLPMERVELLPCTAGLREHLLDYHRVHIALDTFPYNGTTTTCEALLMGVPVVTMCGHAHVSRVGHSLLYAAGLGDLSAQDEDAFVACLERLATDRGRLHALQSGLRERLLNSALLNQQAHGQQVAQFLKQALSPSH